MSKIRETALSMYRHPGNSFDELNKAAEQFDSMSEDDLHKELEHIQMYCCKYDASSVTYYRIAIILFNVVCKRHNISIEPKILIHDEQKIDMSKIKLEKLKNHKLMIDTFCPELSIEQISLNT